MTQDPERDTELPDDETELPDEFHRNRRQHGGAAQRLDDDQLARLTEEERVEAGLDAYDPDEVPDAEDDDVEPDVTESEGYQDEEAEVRRESAAGELGGQADRGSFPPSHYDDQ